MVHGKVALISWVTSCVAATAFVEMAINFLSMGLFVRGAPINSVRALLKPRPSSPTSKLINLLSAISRSKFVLRENCSPAINFITI